MFRIVSRCRSAIERSSRSSSAASGPASDEPATGVQQATGRRRTRRSWWIAGSRRKRCHHPVTSERQSTTVLRRSSSSTSRQTPLSLPSRLRRPTISNPACWCSRRLASVLGEDAALDRPDPGRLGRGDQRARAAAGRRPGRVRRRRRRYRSRPRLRRRIGRTTGLTATQPTTSPSRRATKRCSARCDESQRVPSRRRRLEGRVHRSTFPRRRCATTPRQCSGWSSATVIAGASDRHQQQPAFGGGWMTGSPFASGCSVLRALTIAPCMPSATSWVNSTEIVLEAGRLQAGDVLALGERAGDAADEASRARPDPPARQPVLGDDVADPDPAARLEHPCDLGQHGRLVGREVDHAVRDHDVDRVRREAGSARSCPSGSGRS